MTITQTVLPGAYLVEPKVYHDERGYFFESFNQKVLGQAIGEDITFVQDNQSRSKYGVVRGLHFQHEPYAQAKLVRVLSGQVLVVIVDVRQGSPTYGKHYSVLLEDQDKKQLFVPKGMAHGFAVLSENAEFFYKCDNFYQPGAESGIIYNDPDLNIDWQLPKDDIVLSAKDQKLQPLKALESSFVY